MFGRNVVYLKSSHHILEKLNFHTVTKTVIMKNSGGNNVFIKMDKMEKIYKQMIKTIPIFVYQFISIDRW